MAALDSRLVDELRRQRTETEWLEFKGGGCSPERIGQYLSALANSARLVGQPSAYLVFGVTGGTHEVKGTEFDPARTKSKGQALGVWLANNLSPDPGFEVEVVDHPEGRVVVFRVSPARGQPVRFGGTAYVRIGASTTELSRHPARERAIWNADTDWSAEACEGVTLADLDPEAVADARRRFAARKPDQADAVSRWNDSTFLGKARLLHRGEITNAAVLLLGREETSDRLRPAHVSRVSWRLKDARDLPVAFENLYPPLLFAADRVRKKIRVLKAPFLPNGTLSPQEPDQYHDWVLRECLHNAIAHQDYLRGGRILVTEYDDRVIFSNFGRFLPGDVETAIRLNVPHSYRNPFLAQAMVELGLMEVQGGGILRMFEIQRQRCFALPDYDLSRADEVTVTVPGKIIDENYNRLLYDRPDLPLGDVLLLDRVQKSLPISRQDQQRLAEEGLVTGPPKSPTIRPPDRDPGTQRDRRAGIRERQRDQVFALIAERGPVGRAEIEAASLAELPEGLSEARKRTLVSNLIQELRRTGRIVNRGTRRKPAWEAARDGD